MKPTLSFANGWRSLQHNDWHHFEVVPVESACLYVLILKSRPLSFRLLVLFNDGRRTHSDFFVC